MAQLRGSENRSKTFLPLPAMLDRCLTIHSYRLSSADESKVTRKRLL